MKNQNTRRGFTQYNKVILNLIQGLQRSLGSLRNDMRGRCQIKFGMTSLCNNGAFTLIELLIVVLIIGILAAVAVPQYQKAVKKSYYAGMLPLLSSIVEAQKLYYIANGTYAQDITQLDINLPITGECGASFTARADSGYKVGDKFCVYVSGIEKTPNSVGVYIGLLPFAKFGLTWEQARESGYEYLFTSNFPGRPAGKTYCRGIAFLDPSKPVHKTHCTGELIASNSYGAWWTMN